MLQDDIEIVRNFVSAAYVITALFPDAIISFYNQELTESDFCGSHYGIVETCMVQGPALLMPCYVRNDFVHFVEDNFDDNYQYDDSAISMFAMLYNIPVVTICPSIARCRDEIKSTFGKSHSSKNTECWHGELVDVSVFRSCTYTQLLKTRKPRLHVKKDSKLNVLFEKCLELKRSGM